MTAPTWAFEVPGCVKLALFFRKFSGFNLRSQVWFGSQVPGEIKVRVSLTLIPSFITPSFITKT